MILYFSCFQRSSGISWVEALAPHGITEKKKPRRKDGKKFQEQLGCFAVTLYEFSRWEKLQSSRSFSPSPVVLLPSPAGPLFCHVLVAPSLTCRETGTLCQSSSRFYSPLSPADMQSINYHYDQGNRNPCRLDVAQSLLAGEIIFLLLYCESCP